MTARKDVALFLGLFLLLTLLSVKVDVPNPAAAVALPSGSNEVRIVDINPEVVEEHPDPEEVVGSIRGSISRTNPLWQLNSSSYLMRVTAPEFHEFFCGSQIYVYNFFLNISLRNDAPVPFKVPIEVVIKDVADNSTRDRVVSVVRVSAQSVTPTTITTYFATQAYLIKTFDIYVSLATRSDVYPDSGQKVLLLEWLLSRLLG